MRNYREDLKIAFQQKPLEEVWICVKAWILQLSSCSLLHALFDGTMFSNKNCQNVFERPTLVVFICQSIAQEKSQTTSPRGGRIYLEVPNDKFDKNIQGRSTRIYFKTT